jgi:hypothetical protein
MSSRAPMNLCVEHALIIGRILDDAEHLCFKRSSVLIFVHFISPVAASRDIWAS